MIEPKQLLTALQQRVTLLEDNLRVRCNAQAEVDGPLRKDYDSAREKGRTGLTYNAWRDEELTQIAVAWILAGVFVRFLEDNELIDVPFLAGGNAARHQRAQDEHSMFFRQHPTASEREYFEHVFNTVAKLPGMRDFFDRRHNPLWRVGPTADAAKALLEFWRKTDPDTGRIVHDFADAEWNTRFLGDLYQDLSEFARKRYALLQTPVFVEQFILDRTLTPAIQTFGFKVVRMIDLTCGSGHFLLGGFQRLFRLWQENEPGENPTVLAQRALNQVFGVDLNPNVVAIARFRLLVAALRACGVTKIANAPDFRLNLAAGDSLLHGARFPTADSHGDVQQTFGGDELFRDELKHFYESEDREELHRILGQQYHVVVGNPPYITVKDRALNQAYRNRFKSCSGKYSLSAPFMERFFDSAIRGNPRVKWDPFAAMRQKPIEPKGDGQDDAPAGYVGMITSNSFMKREFGKKLIEEFLPRWDITHVIDTAGAYIPGHGTPTVVLFGKQQPPVMEKIRTVMGIKGEPATPDDPARGLVWSAILAQVDQPGSESEFVSVADTGRESFHKHPWSIGGGGAAELKTLLDETTPQKLGGVCDSIGITCFTLEDDIFIQPGGVLLRHGLAFEHVREMVEGDTIRDWLINENNCALWPYDNRFQPLQLDLSRPLFRLLWLAKSLVANNKMFAGKTKVEAGLCWYEFGRLTSGKLKTRLTITFGFFATHNHFVLDRGGKLFNRSSPVIKLQEGATEDDHVPLLGLLNCSTACFWLKANAQNRGSTVDQHGARQRTAPFEDFWEFTGTMLERFPIPSQNPLTLAQKLDCLGQELHSHTPAIALTTTAQHTRVALNAAKQRWTETLQRMIAFQEELDWECYQLYGLTEAKLVLPPDQVPLLQLGERAFEIVMARKLAAGALQTTWFERHGSTPITELPAHWPQPYRELVQRRIALMESDRNIALIEQPEYKRRWNVEPWDEQLERALRQWLLNRLECYFFGGERMVECGMRGGGATISDSLAPLRGEGQGGSAASLEKRPSSPQPSPPSAGREGEALMRLRNSFLAGQQPALVSTNQLAAVVETDADFLRVAEIYSGGAGFSVSKLVRELVEAESVPFLLFQRYKDTGLRKRQDWEHVWALQRKEDAIEAEIRGQNPAVSEKEIKELTRKRQREEVGDIPVPPKYASGDFKKSNWWKLRGKLDVPKERWIIYPGAEREGDPSPVIAWAGWDHLRQAKALAEYYVDAGQNRGWEAEQLKPLLAGLAELLPWLKQWHNEFNSDVGMGFGDYIAGFLEDEARKQGTTLEALNRFNLGLAG